MVNDVKSILQMVMVYQYFTNKRWSLGMKVRSVDTQQKLGLDRTPDSDDHTRLISLQLNLDTNATNGTRT